MQRICESFKKATQKHGDQNAKKLFQRISEIKAADSMAVLMTIHQARCHKLKGDKKDLFSVDLIHPLRLLIKPVGNFEDYIEGDVIKFKEMKKVIIWSVDDTHE